VRTWKIFLLPLLLLSSGLTSCVEPPLKSYAAIDGNWHIAGTEGTYGFLPVQSPLLTFAIGVIGNNINASGDVGVNCLNGGAIGGSMSLTGQIASDGTFLLSNSAVPLDSIQITIKGTIPAEGATTWSGSYTVTNAASETSCSFNASSDFVADLYPSLSETYSGTLTGSGLGSGITVTTQITQGAFTSASLVPSLPLMFFTPLSATITVSGSSNLTSGTTTSSQIPVASNRVTGDLFALTYLMNDGSKLNLSGWITDSAGTSLHVVATPFSGINGAGILTRQ
jgi:hypothetical protein